MRKIKGFALLDHSFLPFWAFFVRLFAPRHNARIQFLIAQTRILRSRIDANRIVAMVSHDGRVMLEFGVCL